MSLSAVKGASAQPSGAPTSHASGYQAFADGAKLGSLMYRKGYRQGFQDALARIHKQRKAMQEARATQGGIPGAGVKGGKPGSTSSTSSGTDTKGGKPGSTGDGGTPV